MSNAGQTDTVGMSFLDSVPRKLVTVYLPLLFGARQRTRPPNTPTMARCHGRSSLPDVLVTRCPLSHANQRVSTVS